MGTIHAFGDPRLPRLREAVPPGSRPFNRANPFPPPAARASETTQAWLVDLGALARCRALFAGQPPATSAVHEACHSQQSLLEVPAAYDQFCRSHFASVKRLHPGLTWENACPAYAIALSAHAVLFEALDEDRERLLEANWLRIRGQSMLAWPGARALIADGCSALARLDPLAMRR